MKTVEFKYGIGDPVLIKKIEIIGQIDALMQNINGIQYSVIYWNDGARNNAWLYDWEIDSYKGKA